MDTHTAGRWSKALASDDTTAREAKSELAGAYWYPAYAFFRASGVEGESAATLTESVLTHLIEDPVDGTPLLREWMLDLAKAALADPTPRAPVLTVDREWSEQRFAGEGTHSPGETFVRRWTLDLLEQAVTTLQAEYEAAGKSDAFGAAQSFLGYTGGAEGAEPYAALAAQLGVSDGAARSTVFDLRKRYREILRAAVADTVATEEQIAAELQALLIQLPAPAETVAPRPVLGRLDPEQLLARGMNSVQMSTAGGLGWTPPTIAEAARLFPGYEVVAMLGHGGMGAVYQARQQSLDRLVALKLLPLEISVDPSFADRFRREARAMAKLNHPNIISVHDFGQTSEGHLFFAMEFVEGASLHDLVHKREGGLPPADALGIIEQVCEALSYAHEQGIVHRDIKPANVMIDGRGRAKIADFGLARITDPSAEQWGQTMTGVIMGTPDYMAPEQKRGMQVDSRADIYSVGVMFYEMLCGETPQGAFELPSQRCGLPKELDAVVTRAIAPQVEKRFQTTAELKQAVATAKPSVLRSVARKSQAAAARQPAAVPMVPIVKAAPVAQGNPLVLWGSIAAGVVVLGAVGAFVFGKGKSKPTPPTSAQSQAAANPAAEEPKAEPQTAASKPPAASPAATLKPAEPKASPAPALVAAGNEKWVDGLAQWFGGKNTNGTSVRENNGGARIGADRVTIQPIPRSAPAFRDQVARVRWHPLDAKGGMGLLVRHTMEAAGGVEYVATIKLVNNVTPRLRLTGAGQPRKVLGNRDWPLAPDFEIDATHTMEFRVVGDLLTATVDGKKVAEVRDAGLAAGHPVITAENVVIESFEYANLDSAESKPAPAPALVAAGDEKWVDGLAQWFGGTKTNDAFVRENNGGARIGSGSATLSPIPRSARFFRDQVARVRWSPSDANSSLEVHLRRALPTSAPASGEGFAYHAGLLQKEEYLAVRLACRVPGKPYYGLQDPKLPADFKIDATHTLEFRVVGELLSVSVDGKKIGEYRDSQIKDGHPAITAKNVVIESFEYANLDPAAPAPALASAKPIEGTAKPAMAAAPQPASTTTAAAATIAPAFENTLGMQFVPVPITGGPTNGQRVLFSIWETRVQDFQVFADETKREWPKPDFEQGPTHPAVNVNWEDAQAFCAWLTERERKAGKLGANELYRLPSDHEWSCAVGIGDQEDAAKLPSEKSEKIGGYPWGKEWPPPDKAGNYNSAEIEKEHANGKLKQVKSFLAGRHDGYAATAPAGSYSANRFGIHDLGGNVWEWCEDSIDKERKLYVWRGAAWNDDGVRYTLTSRRVGYEPVARTDRSGFRVVLAPASAISPAGAVATASSAAASGSAPSSNPPRQAELSPPPAKPGSEMEKWLAQVDGPQQESYQREVMKPFEAGLAELQKGYLGALDSRIATASTGGQLDVALGWRNELQRFREGGQAVPADDADLATVAAPLVAKALPPLRTQFRTHKAKLDADRLARAKVAFAKYDAVLSPNITLLTQRQRLDDALLLKTKRDEVQKAWLPAASAPAAPAPGAPSTPAPKPLGSGTVATPAPAPTSKAATAAAIRAAAEWVIKQGGQIEVPGKKITKLEELPAGPLAVTAVIFRLNNAAVPGAELQALTALGAVTNIKVEDWNAPDSTLTFLQAFGNVGLLDFVGCPQLTDAMLEALPAMPNLGRLSLQSCQGITGKGFAKLKSPKLADIDLNKIPVTDEGLAAISRHEGLKSLVISGPAITDAGVAHLERLRALTSLKLIGTSVTPAALSFLGKRKEFTLLEYLNAASPDFVANAQAIAKIVPNLPTLVVTGKASGPEATRALLGFKGLRSLQWGGSEMNDATFGELAALTDLEDLSLRGAPLTDAAMDTVLALKKLTILDFCDNPELTDAGLLKLKPLKKLKRVHFSRTKATEAGAAELKKAIPGVQVFR